MLKIMFNRFWLILYVQVVLLEDWVLYRRDCDVRQIKVSRAYTYTCSLRRGGSRICIGEAWVAIRYVRRMHIMSAKREVPLYGRGPGSSMVFIRCSLMLAIYAKFKHSDTKNVFDIFFLWGRLISPQNPPLLSSITHHSVCMHSLTTSYIHTQKHGHRNTIICLVSWESEGRYQYSKMFRWESEGRYRCIYKVNGGITLLALNWRYNHFFYVHVYLHIIYYFNCFLYGDIAYCEVFRQACIYTQDRGWQDARGGKTHILKNTLDVTIRQNARKKGIYLCENFLFFSSFFPGRAIYPPPPPPKYCTWKATSWFNTLRKKRFFGCPTGGIFKGSLNGSKWVFRTIFKNLFRFFICIE